MKELIKCIARVVCVIMFVSGLILCASDAETWSIQWRIGLLGIGMMLGSVVIGYMTKEEEDVVQ